MRSGGGAPPTHSPGEVALQVVAGAARVQRLGVVGVQAQHGAEVCDGGVDAAQLLVGNAPVVQCIHIAGLQGNDCAVVLQGCVVLACVGVEARGLAERSSGHCSI